MGNSQYPTMPIICIRGIKNQLLPVYLDSMQTNTPKWINSCLCINSMRTIRSIPLINFYIFQFQWRKEQSFCANKQDHLTINLYIWKWTLRCPIQCKQISSFDTYVPMPCTKVGPLDNVHLNASIQKRKKMLLQNLSTTCFAPLWWPKGCASCSAEYPSLVYVNHFTNVWDVKISTGERGDICVQKFTMWIIYIHKSVQTNMH